jgi:type IV secretory pathway TrbD component
MNEEIPSNYYTPVHRSLVRPLLLLGIPQGACTALWTTVLGLVFGAGEFWALPLGVAAHSVAAALTRVDPDFWAVFRGALYAPDRVEPQ